jgi:Ca-activated chloride channel family protein
MKARYLLVLILSLWLSPVVAQNARQLVRQGNKQFRLGNAAESEVSYRKAVEKDARNPQANYNLGNALMLQRKDSLAITQFEKAAKQETNPLRRAQAFHNMGVVCQQHQMFGEAIEAYKEALRNNPTDDQTRYNLALCKRQQQQQQNQQQQQQNKDNKDQQDKNQQQQQKQQKEQQKEDEQKMSKENAEQLLNAAMQEEKQTQERMKKAMQKPQKRQLEKNW